MKRATARSGGQGVTGAIAGSAVSRSLSLLLAVCAPVLALRAQAQPVAGDIDSGGESSAQTAPATSEYYFPSGTAFDASIPRPDEFFGFQVGDWHLRPEQILRYLAALDAASPRVQMEEIGRTYEQQPLVVLTITSPANHENLDALRAEHRALLTERAPAVVDALPVVVYLGYSIHGDEPSGTNAAPLVAYYLAAAQGTEIEEKLARSIILLDPCMNPDGLGRFASWANSHRGAHPVADPLHRERREPWPSGRGNHYWFDLNRDWLLAQHPESRARLGVFHRWKPNLVGDFHEMGSEQTFFFQPGVPSRRHPLTPGRNDELTRSIANYPAAALDQLGVLYFTEEQYDDFYHGKGSTYPDIQGAVGILFEQASSEGQRRESTQGELSFRFTIRNQVTASLAILDGALANRIELLEYQRQFHQEERAEALARTPAGWVFGDRHDRGRGAFLADLFRQHDLEVRPLVRALDVAGKRFEPGSAYVVTHRQPGARLLRSMLETRTSFPDSVFYDISTWSLPLAFDMPFAELDAIGDLAGEPLTRVEMPAGSVPGNETAYAYAYSWAEHFAPRALFRLQARGVNARVATRPFTARSGTKSVSFDYGTIVVPIAGQTRTREEIQDVLQDIAERDGVDVLALQSGLTVEGIDLGSPNLRPLAPARPAIAVGPRVSSSQAGEFWHALDHRFELPAALLEVGDWKRLDLERYTHLIFPSGSYDALGDAGRAALAGWIEDGGVLIAVGSAVRFVEGQRLAGITYRSASPDATRPATARLEYARHREITSARELPGSIFGGSLDRTHPLGYGYTRTSLPLFRSHQIFVEPSANPFATVIQYEREPLKSGYVTRADLRRLAGSAALLAERHGRGAVVCMLDDPCFRGFWLGTERLLLNAICFGQVLEQTSPEPNPD